MHKVELKVAFFDAKPFDREFFTAENIQWLFFESRLSSDTAKKLEGVKAVCPFVHCCLDRECLKMLKNRGVEYIALRSAGYNHIDLKAAEELQFQVTRVPAYSPQAVAEHAVAMLLCLNRKIHLAYQRVSEKNFTLNGLMGFNLYRKKAGIVGAGHIGKAAAQILSGFGMQVMALDPLQDLAWAKSFGVDYVSLDRLLEQSDVVLLHTSLVPQTHHLIHENTLRKMKPEALLVNTSRGPVIDTKALIQALVEKRIGGAALDVYEKEAAVFFEDFRGKELNDPELETLLGLPNVLITPHQGFFTREALEEIAGTTTQNLTAFAENKPFLPETVLLTNDFPK